MNCSYTRNRLSWSDGSGIVVGKYAELTAGSEGYSVASYDGTAWSARNDAPSPLARGQRCRVSGVDGLLLHIRPEGGASS